MTAQFALPVAHFALASAQLGFQLAHPLIIAAKCARLRAGGTFGFPQAGPHLCQVFVDLLALSGRQALGGGGNAQASLGGAQGFEPGLAVVAGRPAIQAPEFAHPPGARR